jgi:lipopolysaccharide 1,2-glucosyltransferase
MREAETSFQLVMPTNTYHIAFAINKNYYPYLAVALKSFCLCTPQQEEVRWHIHLIIIEEDEQSCIAYFLPIIDHREDIFLEAHLINSDAYSQYNNTRFTLLTLIRAELPILLPEVEKVLYLDTDILFKGNIAELFTFDMQGHSTALVSETTIKPYHYTQRKVLNHQKYYNAGVMLMDLTLWRAHNNRQIFFDFLEKNYDELAFPDQDTINVVFYDEIIELPIEYNITYQHLTDYNNYLSPQKERIHNSLFAPKIVHFAACAPWDSTVPRHPYRKDWWEIAKKLPFDIPTTRRNNFKIRCILRAFFFVRWLQGKPHNPSLRYLQQRYHNNK